MTTRRTLWADSRSRGEDYQAIQQANNPSG